MKKIFIILAAVVCLVGCSSKGSGSAEFTVNNQGGKVVFSPGNLQYQASTDTWRFAEHQWDVLEYENKNISKTYDGWIDLFGWGTGNNPTCYSEKDINYKEFVDWGVNPISNGGNMPNEWRTLTAEEWYYVLCERPHADKLRSIGVVNNVGGYIILPDNWSKPFGVHFTPDALNWDNVYYDENWEKMEKAGAAFFPWGGIRYGKGDELFMTNTGEYWSSSVDRWKEPLTFSTDNAINRYLGLKNIDSSIRCQGISVRLVKDIKP